MEVMVAQHHARLEIPTILINMSQGENTSEARAAKDALDSLLDRHANASLVMLKLILPQIEETPPPQLLASLSSDEQRERKARWSVSETSRLASQAHSALGCAMEEFQRRCPELVDRTKLGNGRTRRECTNVC